MKIPFCRNKRDRAEDNHDDDMSENGASTSDCPSPRTSVYFNRGVTDSIWTAKKKGRTIRSGSIYVKSRRFSRYGNLSNFFKPYLTTTKPKKDEIPIDSIGLFNNITFWWVTKYRINEKKLKSLAMERILPTTTKDDEDEKSYLRALQIPAPTAKERTAVNQKRLLAKFGDEEQIEENSERSMYHVLWSFSKTRYLITFFPHVLVLATLLVFPLMLKLTSDSIYNEYVKLNNTKHYETLSVSEMIGRCVLPKVLNLIGVPLYSTVERGLYGDAKAVLEHPWRERQARYAQPIGRWNKSYGNVSANPGLFHGAPQEPHLES